jgi:hypothetical protein
MSVQSNYPAMACKVLKLLRVEASVFESWGDESSLTAAASADAGVQFSFWRWWLTKLRSALEAISREKLIGDFKRTA